ncbi:unnamed protein product [Paramecium sonneborni]|uniref:Uncharacterized protein n=1 Tax=Paramecium sonneborni TaxID=65129 RepID=A0A8S1K0F1_9CILI|nr:unnamed protein product [Paramecium sonneborni]
MNYHNNIGDFQHKVLLEKIEPKIKSIQKKTKDNQNNKDRTNWIDNLISKTAKKYSISFKQNLYQIEVVENWKKYNCLENISLILEAEFKKMFEQLQFILNIIYPFFVIDYYYQI